MRKVGRGEVVKVANLFEKYSKILKAPEASVINQCIEVLNDVMGVVIDKKKFSYSVATKTLFISVSGPLKTEIMLQKKEIITHLKGRLGEKSAPIEIL